MLGYSDDALAVRPRFFAPYNEITIVIEDLAGEPLYTQILKRLLGDKMLIHSVLGMGGKAQVMQRFEDRETLPEVPIEFYIVDGDFDELIGRTCPTSKNFYRLNRYDIESFLLEETPICIVAEEEQPSRSLDQHKNELNIHDWKLENINLWIPLAACAALMQRDKGGEIKVDLGVERYRTGDKVVIDQSRIDSTIGRVMESDWISDKETFKREMEAMTTQMGESCCEGRRWVSGKSVFVPLLIRLLRRHVKRNFRKEALCFRLAKHCEFRDLQELRNLILDVATVGAT